jgi:hypothetical protein
MKKYLPELLGAICGAILVLLYTMAGPILAIVLEHWL